MKVPKTMRERKGWCLCFTQSDVWSCFSWNLLDFDLQTDEEAVDISGEAIKQEEEDKSAFEDRRQLQEGKAEIFF